MFSLRSTDEGMDVSEVASQYGGGGHRNASGFRVPFGHELTL
ncbi:DHHA1 domain-containing protein [Pseudomonas fluorescens]|nr:DHHA1 domain-containing protein [Pseudomonas fluorescens]